MFLSSLLLLACNQAPAEPQQAAIPPLPDSGPVVATVNGTPIHQGAVDAALQLIPEAQRKQLVSSGRTEMLTQDLIEKEILVQEALKRGLDKDPETRTMIAFSIRQALIGSLFKKVGEERATDEAIRQWYEDHKVQFHKPQVHAAHILVDDEATAREVLAKAQAPGADFAALAQQFSKDKGSAAKGGDLGWFEKERMVPEFAEAAFSAEPGTVTGPVQTRFGWHVIKVLEKRDAIPLEDVRDQIEARVRNEAMQQFVEELKAGADIQVGSGSPQATVTPTPAATPGGQPAPAPASGSGEGGQ